MNASTYGITLQFWSLFRVIWVLHRDSFPLKSRSESKDKKSAVEEGLRRWIYNTVDLLYPLIYLRSFPCSNGILRRGAKFVQVSGEKKNKFQGLTKSN